MIEKVFNYSQDYNNRIEKVISDENLQFIHMVFIKDDGLPEHYSNATLYMNVLRGNLSISLDDEDVKVYVAGTVLKIKKGVRMNVKNFHDDILEIIVIKVPAPGEI